MSLDVLQLLSALHVPPLGEQRGQREAEMVGMEMLLRREWARGWNMRLHLDTPIKRPGQQLGVGGRVTEQQEASDLFLVALQYRALT